jgi:hypothetical protein
MWLASAKLSVINRQETEEEEEPRRTSYELEYPTSLLIPGTYVLLYFDSKSASVLGMSTPFKVST